ncbi:hypothetical protein PFLUV_G00246790 [Perca fluviatilis]|uniref:AIG1-type G domain-containing protein n=1 Tax=Perca fluviatilis TaxID=8168 RepID=A0A6A5EJM8_PERFL|nr:hypothetical protein PFLUV_G00246790 [Perca fluviatilis]
MECQCEKDNAEDAVTDWWLNSNNIQMGAFTVVGYLLYRFSQTLPALIRWPIRLFCTLTGLTALWSWVSHLVGTLRGIQSLCNWLSGIWRFIEASSSKFKSLISANTEMDPSSRIDKPGLRLILLGPMGGGRTSLADTLLGNSETKAPTGTLMQSTKRRTTNSRRETDQDAAQAIRATLELFGDGVAGYIIPVFTHADRLGPKRTVDQLLDVDSGGLQRALSLSDQRPELVDNRPDCPPEAQSVMRRQLLERVVEMKTLRGHFVHELQRREDRIREELLADMGSALAGKLGHT